MNVVIKILINADGSWNNDHYKYIVTCKGRYLKNLHQGLNDKNPLIREGCAEALGDIGFLQSVSFLIEHADDPNEEVRWDVVNSLERILGFQPSVLKEWLNCDLRSRHKFKKR